MSSTNLVDEGGGIVNVEHEGQIDASHNIITSCAIRDGVVVCASVLSNDKSNAVTPISLMATRSPLAKLHTITLNDASATSRDSQEQLGTLPLLWNYRPQKK